eukprot:sb/3472552/
MSTDICKGRKVRPDKVVEEIVKIRDSRSTQHDLEEQNEYLDGQIKERDENLEAEVENRLQETSREKIKGTRLCSVLALVGVGAGIKSLSHLERSRDKTEGTKMISVLKLVGVGAGIKSLSHLPLRNGLETFHWCHLVGNSQVMGGRRRTFKLYLQPNLIIQLSN